MAKCPITQPSLLGIDVSKLQKVAWEAKMRKMAGMKSPFDSKFATPEEFTRWTDNRMKEKIVLEGLNPDFRDIIKNAIIKGLANGTTKE